MRKCKVWGGLWQARRPGLRVIVNETSKKNALAALERAGHRLSGYEFSNFWNETGSADELRAMANMPAGQVLARPNDGPDHRAEFMPLADAEKKWWGRGRVTDA